MLDPDLQAVMRAIAGPWADRYISEQLLPGLQRGLRLPQAHLKDLRTGMNDPYRCLQAFFTHYAFARRGRDRDDLGEMACQALRRCAGDDFVTLLTGADGECVWEAFCEICAERKRKTAEQLNKGILAGMVELAQEIYRLDGVGSVANWIWQGVLHTDRIEPQFLRIVDIRGVGPKTTSTFLRDMVFLYGLEDQIEHADRLYIQPVDKWSRMFAEMIVPELEDSAVDWIIAGKLSKYTRRSGISGVRFNMGASYFGIREVHDSARFELCVQSLLP